jgi:mannose-1-phosphate guanylyltransferase/mannose-6-phosphate isomerase
MPMDLEKYTICENAMTIDALRKIDTNRKGFLMVVKRGGGAERQFLGTLTDGDIRRAFLSGKRTDDAIDGIYKRECIYAKPDWNASDVVEAFKNEAVGFLPIVADDGALLNVITKKQMHTLLLTNRGMELTNDFSDIDGALIDYEIFPRPWGFYKTTVMNEYFQSKVITVYPKASMSLQAHNRREEHWIIAHGNGVAQVGESLLDLRSGSSIFIPKGCKHRLTNTGESENLILTEVQLGDYFGEDDIVRYEDNYGRA